MARPRPWYEAFAPATVSNLGPGFDCLGLALTTPGDRVRARLSDTPGVVLAKIDGDGGKLDRDPQRNTAGVAVAALLRQYAPDAGIELELFKGLPLGSGLGSSGASACAALVAADAALGLGLAASQHVELARLGEQVACGAAHADNVAPSLLGGIVLIANLDPLRLISLPQPNDLWLAIYTPGCSVQTAVARQALPTRVPLPATVQHAARLGLLVHALHEGDLSLVGEAIVDDLVEPVRAQMIPGYLDAKAACQEAGALACSISGAGPTVFALASSSQRAETLLQILDESFTHTGIPGKGLVDQVGPGARLLSRPLH